MNSQRPFFEHLDSQQTSLGLLSLRRRNALSLGGIEVHEVVLGDAFLMSSLFTAVEIALSDLGLAAVSDDLEAAPTLDVVVGGLGLGYTAQAALKYPSVKKVVVAEFLKPVIEWHEKGLVPLGSELSNDPRCEFLHCDFFERATAGVGEEHFAEGEPEARFDAVLLDIDHSPSKLLCDGNAGFYEAAGLQALAEKLHPGGVFALWSDDPPEDQFLSSLREVFGEVETHIVPFHNPIQDCESQSTVYVAKRVANEA